METACVKAFVILDGMLLVVGRIVAGWFFFCGEHEKHGMYV